MLMIGPCVAGSIVDLSNAAVVPQSLSKDSDGELSQRESPETIEERDKVDELLGTVFPFCGTQTPGDRERRKAARLELIHRPGLTGVIFRSLKKTMEIGDFPEAQLRALQLRRDLTPEQVRWLGDQTVEQSAMYETSREVRHGYFVAYALPVLAKGRDPRTEELALRLWDENVGGKLDIYPELLIAMGESGGIASWQRLKHAGEDRLVNHARAQLEIRLGITEKIPSLDWNLAVIGCVGPPALGLGLLFSLKSRPRC